MVGWDVPPMDGTGRFPIFGMYDSGVKPLKFILYQSMLVSYGVDMNVTWLEYPIVHHE